jgi:hypothetical protein
MAQESRMTQELLRAAKKGDEAQVMSTCLPCSYVQSRICLHAFMRGGHIFRPPPLINAFMSLRVYEGVLFSAYSPIFSSLTRSNSCIMILFRLNNGGLNQMST